MSSQVKIFTGDEAITKVEDRWNGQIPEGAFKTVRLFNIFSWLNLAECVFFWLWSFVWWTWWWKVCHGSTTTPEHG